MSDRPDAAAFLAAEYPRLLRTAFLLTGDGGTAQDLTQETAVRLLANWRSVRRADNPHAYARKVMLNVHLRGKRRAWHGEIPTGRLPDEAARSAYAGVDDRDMVMRALAQLPERQRAAVVLRHHEGLSEAETAALLGCSVGNVKSLTSRGASALRAALDDKDLCHDR